MNSKKLTPLSAKDWETFLSQHDLTWTSVGAQWEQGAFLGNGTLGAMIYRDSDKVLRWELGCATVVETFQIPTVDWAPPRLLIGDFLLETKGEIESIEMRLDLWNAEATGLIKTDQGQVKWCSLVHANDMALLIETETEGDEKDATITFRPQSAASPCLHYDRIRQKVDPEWLAQHTPEAPRRSERGGISISTQNYIGGGQYAVAWKKTVEKRHALLYATVHSSYPHLKAAETAYQNIADASAQPLPAWVDTHRNWWNEYYPKSFLSFDDSYWESLYWIQMYKFGSATREDSPIIDSQGPWMPQTPWPTCVWNLNVQTSYAPLFASNRFELGESLYTRLDKGLPDLIMNVPDSFRSDSAGIGRATSSITLRATTSPGWETGNLAWVCFNYYRHYRCSMDDQLLRDRLYPLLRRAINYYFHLVDEKDDGRIHLLYTVSPEYGPDKYTRDCNYDLALFRWGCRALLDITQRLGIEDERKADWQDVLDRLIDPPADEFGLRIGQDIGYRMSHRHFSHLFFIWPLRIHNADYEDHLEQTKRSVDHWLSMDEELQGYTWTSSSNMASSFGNGNLALERLNKLRAYLQPNTMYTENGPVIETPLSAAESIHDMFLQSWTDPRSPKNMHSVIRVFPAVPDAWKNIAFHDLRAEGAFLVSASRKDGVTQWIRIESLAGEPCALQTDIPGLPETSSDIQLTPEGENRWSIPLAKGETILLYPAGTTPDLKLTPVHRPPQEANPFGMASDKASTHSASHAH